MKVIPSKITHLAQVGLSATSSPGEVGGVGSSVVEDATCRQKKSFKYCERKQPMSNLEGEDP